MEEKSEHMRILEMIESGRISVEEGLGLLAALDSAGELEVDEAPDLAEPPPLASAARASWSEPSRPGWSEPIPSLPAHPARSQRRSSRGRQARRLRQKSWWRSPRRAAAGCGQMAALVGGAAVDRRGLDRAGRGAAVRWRCNRRAGSIFGFSAPLCPSRLACWRLYWPGKAAHHPGCTCECSRRRARRHSRLPSACRSQPGLRPGSCAPSGTRYPP